MRKVIDFLARLGVTEGPTFRCVQQEGVGMFIEPNPTPNRMNPQAVPTPRRFTARRASGKWTAKRAHTVW